MNKKLLLTVLAAGLVFPTATANANPSSTFVEDNSKPAEVFTSQDLVNGQKRAEAEKAANNNNLGLSKDPVFVENIEQKEIPTNVVEGQRAKKDKNGNVVIENVYKERTEGPKSGNTNDAPQNTTTTKATTKGGNKGPVAKPAVKNAVAKAKASAKTGAKKLPKTSAVK